MGTRRGCSRRGRWRGAGGGCGVSGELSEPPRCASFPRHDFKGLFVGVVRVAREMGLARFGKVSIDGTNVRIDELWSDAREGAGIGGGGRGIADGLAHRCAGGAAATRRRAARGAAPSRGPGDSSGRFGQPPTIRAGAGPDGSAIPRAGSRTSAPVGSLMRRRRATSPTPTVPSKQRGGVQCYNAQVAVDGEQQLIVATELTSNASDQGAMMGLLDEVKETFDTQPETVLADAGYCNERDLSELEARGIDGYVASGWRTRTRRGTRRRTGWSRSWPRPRAGSGTRNASGCPRRPMVGSRKCSDSGGSVYEAWPRRGGNGTWCAWR